VRKIKNRSYSEPVDGARKDYLEQKGKSMLYELDFRNEN
jgi:hypothetical protein